MNRSKDLVELFRLHIKNKHNRTYSYTNNYGGVNRCSYNNPPYMNNIHRIPGTGYPTIGKDIKIFFYEWSDVTRRPKQFDSLTDFDNFLKGYGIYLQLWQRELITDVGISFVSCYRGKKELCVRGDYKYLLESMNDYDRAQTKLEMESQGVPYNKGNGNIPTPPMYALGGKKEMEPMQWFG